MTEQTKPKLRPVRQCDISDPIGETLRQHHEQMVGLSYAAALLLIGDLRKELTAAVEPVVVQAMEYEQHESRAEVDRLRAELADALVRTRKLAAEVDQLLGKVAEQDALLTQAYASNGERQEELVQLDAALEKALAERDRLAEVSGRVLDLTTTALRYGTDSDRQIKVAVDRGDSAEELFYAGAYRALQAVRDLIRGGHALTWDGTPHSTSGTETAATSTRILNLVEQYATARLTASGGEFESAPAAFRAAREADDLRMEITTVVRSTPSYVHRLLDAYLTGHPLDFGGEQVPADVVQRLAAAPSGEQPTEPAAKPRPNRPKLTPWVGKEWPPGGDPNRRWRDCGTCEDDIWPGEQVYPAQDGGIECVVCHVKAPADQSGTEEPTTEPAGEVDRG